MSDLEPGDSVELLWKAGPQNGVFVRRRGGTVRDLPPRLQILWDLALANGFVKEDVEELLRQLRCGGEEKQLEGYLVVRWTHEKTGEIFEGSYHPNQVRKK